MGKRKQYRLFADQRTQDVFDGFEVAEIDDTTAEVVYDQIYRLLRVLKPEAMRHPPSNRLLKEGNRYKIWISQDWVLWFEWHRGEAKNIQLVENTSNYWE